MQTGPKREYVMAIMADNQGIFAELFKQYFKTNALFIRVMLVTKPFHFAIHDNYFHFGTKVCTFAPTLILVTSTGVKSM